MKKERGWREINDVYLFMFYLNITTQYPASARYFAMSMTRLLQSLAF